MEGKNTNKKKKKKVFEKVFLLFLHITLCTFFFFFLEKKFAGFFLYLQICSASDVRLTYECLVKASQCQLSTGFCTASTQCNRRVKQLDIITNKEKRMKKYLQHTLCMKQATSLLPVLPFKYLRKLRDLRIIMGGYMKGAAFEKK